MIIELKEIKTISSNMFLRETYKTPGLKLCYDGIAYHIVHVPEDGSAPYAIPVPFEEIKKNIIEKERTSFVDELITLLPGQINEVLMNHNQELSNRLKQLEFLIKGVDDKINHAENKTHGVTGDVLLKALAIAQSPEIATNLLTEPIKK